MYKKIKSIDSRLIDETQTTTNSGISLFGQSFSYSFNKDEGA